MAIDLEKIKKLPPDIKKDFMRMYLRLAEKKKILKIREDFLSFTRHIWPEFIEGAHHRIVAKKFNDLATGKLKRLIVNMPPRHTKSEFASSLLPAWMIGRNPKLKIIQTTHTGELAVRFGRKAKHLIDSPEYQEIFKIFFFSANLKYIFMKSFFTSGGSFLIFSRSIAIYFFAKFF